MKFKEYIDYWEKAAKSNKALGHDPEHDKIRFRRMNIEEVITATKTDLLEKALILENPEVRTSDALSDNPRKMLAGAIMLIAEYEKGNFNDEMEKIDEMETLAEQFQAKIINDVKKFKQNPGHPNKIKGIDLNTFRMQKVSNLFGYWSGWRLEFTFNQTFSNGLVLKNEDWKDDTAFSI